MNVDIEDLQLISNELAPCFYALKDKNIFLTGGTGFFGKWLLEAVHYLNEYMALGLSVTVLSRNPDSFKLNFPHLCKDSKVTFIKGDIRDFSLDLESVDYIIHAATDASAALNKENPSLMRSTIMEGAKSITNFANKVKCKRLLYTSSGAAYGPQPSDIKGLSEDFVDNPNFNKSDAYASAKLESENYFKNNLECDLVIARCFAFSGPYLPLNGSYAFGNFIFDALEGRDITLYGDGSAVRSYLYAADLIIWLFKALVLGKDNSIYNIGSPDAVTTLNLAQKICGTENNVNILNRMSDKGNVYIPCTEKSQHELGVKVYTSLDDAIKKTLDFYRVL